MQHRLQPALFVLCSSPRVFFSCPCRARRPWRAALLFSDSVIPTGVAGFFFRAVRGAPATKRRDRGNQP